MPEEPELALNVLAERYASPALRRLWSQRGRVVLERRLWIAVLKAQRDLGLAVPQEAINAYERSAEQVDLDSIARRERITRHDVKARIEEFCARAGWEHIHKGMTSRDLTENVEQLQVHRSLLHVRDRAVAALAILSRRAKELRDQVITARTHNVAAQVTTMGKRLAMFGEELLRGFETIERLAAHYPVRGLQGAVGTQLDQLNLFENDPARVRDLEDRVLHHLGIARHWVNTGQVYPRSLDFEVVAALVQLASGPASLAKTLRLMAGHDLASEGFAPGQTGSSAMPHKRNSRSCERIQGFHTLLKGYLSMAAGLAGDQWNEGDVSCSVVRRVMLPDSFFAIDGLFETFLTVLGQFEVFPAVIDAEIERCLPFLLSTSFLMEAVKRGAGRESAHKTVKEHALAAAADLREGKAGSPTLLDRLAADPRLELDPDTLRRIMEEGRTNTGNAGPQVDAFCEAVEAIIAAHPEAAAYRGEAIL
ncbi:MAG TPA: adenylosuccinate lyase [Verrucomicrobiales bacterium]|nr:adenylosuccinate lyase [Verrucomicrobiales bacterium]